MAAAAVIVLYLLYAFFWRGIREPATKRSATSTKPVLYRTEKQMKRIMGLRFRTLSRKVKRSYVIPGLKAAESLQGEFRALVMCTSMTPQGLCVTEDYLFITAYCHTGKHNSVLFMLDRVTGDYIKTIILGGKAHVGGAAYDPVHRNVWISGGTGDVAKAVCYSLESLEEYDSSSHEPLTAVHNYTLASIARSSYMTYVDGFLLVGLFRRNGRAELEWFRIAEDGGLYTKLLTSYDEQHEIVMMDYMSTTPESIQGLAYEEPEYLFSKSYGIFDSIVRGFRTDEIETDFMIEEAVFAKRFPQKLEQICVADGEFYCLFESAAYAYSMQPAIKIDRVLVFDLADILS